MPNKSLREAGADPQDVYHQDAEFWTKYKQARPPLTEKLLDKIIAYHTQHGGSFDLVHDVGSGAGIYSDRLATRFKNVLLSDRGDQNIKTAQSLLGSDSKYTYKTMSMEEGSTLPANSVDMVFAANMMHYVDQESAMNAVYHQLKPGGTFVALLSFLFVLEDQNLQNQLLKLWNAKIDTLFEEAGGVSNKSMCHLVSHQASGLDAVPVPGSMFKDVQRWNYNDPGGKRMQGFLITEKTAAGLETLSSIGPQDDVHYIENKDDLSFRKTWQDIKALIDSIPLAHGYPDVERLQDEFAQSCGERQLKGVWITNLVFATKR